MWDDWSSEIKDAGEIYSEEFARNQRLVV